ncbi:MAG TPA: porin [Limnohabitans sp.]|uniref:porin n=1 Tax=Limnohabitans sp. TaxID=1907725 RepID=UPI002B81176C|nr:porin [Limnohabitans sp.]HQR86933.1 porin [Limnohabitans sp.]HQS26969.1 porin [Limnohabitans sp.]
MKKTLIAIAALAATSAFAQSSVTLYGVMNGGVNQVKSTNAAGVTTTTSANNAAGAWASNRLGFTGTEDLGGGMKAAFTYELGMNADGTGDLGATGGVRQSHVTLSGGMGSINFGRQYNPAFLLNIAFDAGAANNLSAGRTVYGNGPITTARSSGLATYTSPTMGGFTAKLASGTNTVDNGTTETGTKVMGGSVAYANGPLMVAYGFHNINAVNAAGDKDEAILGATYKMGAATLLASTGTSKTKDAAGAQTVKKAATQVGVKYPFGKVDTFLTYGTATDNTIVGSADVKSTAYQAGAIYNFSKRTGAYAAYGQNKNETGSVKNSELAVGVRHSF